MTHIGLEVRKAGLEKGSYPADLSAFPGAKAADPRAAVLYALHPDGSATLAVSDAEALFGKITQAKGAAFGFTWTLPPVTAGKPSPSSHPAK